MCAVCNCVNGGTRYTKKNEKKRKNKNNKQNSEWQIFACMYPHEYM